MDAGVYRTCKLYVSTGAQCVLADAEVPDYSESGSRMLHGMLAHSMMQLTFRTLFWSSEAILTVPLEESGGRAIPSAYPPTELFVFLDSSS